MIMLQLSSFATPEQVPSLIAAGADYVELFLTSTVTPLSSDEFEQMLIQSRTWPIRPRTFAGLLPREMRVTGPNANPSTQDSYLRGVFSRIGQLTDGDGIVVFGSGTARSIPDGYDRDRALDQLEQFMSRAALLANDEGITFTLEPLNRRESNVFNSIMEAGAFIRDRELNNVFLIADLFHMMEENEPLSSIAQYGDLIVHTHIADTNRAAPGTGLYPLVEFFRALQLVGYLGRSSIECVWEDFDEQIDSSMTYCRAARADAGW